MPSNNTINIDYGYYGYDDYRNGHSTSSGGMRIKIYNKNTKEITWKGVDTEDCTHGYLSW